MPNRRFNKQVANSRAAMMAGGRAKKKGGGFKKCGRSKLKSDRKRKYPKCVPAAKAARMTESQRRSAVKRKRSKAQGVGGKPTNGKNVCCYRWVHYKSKKGWSCAERFWF